MAAIPTRYKGRQYRSLLDAKWAAFFDLLRWPVEYEPFECDGWIPDFIIAGAHPVLVEVKPRIDMVEREKVIVPGYETLAVSATPFDGNHALAMSGFMPLGRLMSPPGGGWPDNDTAVFNASRAEIARATGRDYDFRADEGWYAERISGVYEGDDHLIWGPIHHDAIRDAWAEAANRVQWKRPT